jgi:hypothetical protein
MQITHGSEWNRPNFTGLAAMMSGLKVISEKEATFLFGKVKNTNLVKKSP